ncbi:hypothetical protein COU62_01950 [Candidatus Pacearchaeota archaeon CG10_big_fil_rev_8_21_14_0_10_35_219]|nr:hypothetical protein [Candidatus Pacearchaeota archaeon]OIO42532.1 MAG: hypothetical protein AUJ63_02510 [Candidatus Pacearchaeota archaeon CG1_02_35_32]PIO07955.1 MAG: hypothetical protein COU62_01950 [Candidatus Pacearchaeota archaeon CG10_big_fil_rev_8_21_14_0_10_35_219]PIY81410.1 MAG: hypothetical protein COY79_02760 [Candidatus Pacearchaeota archaeon CG_4_10_14_0_8_um_filter_35_169]PIZ80626.1 MAG: hypothetical protein COY00_00685 [Candidatus Pacearchaeota archaeon CG_4_10_14_0_2_um_filt
MKNKQRMKNDLATDNRREAVDRTLSNNRNRNDALTQERRFESDKTLNKNRARNDEITTKRREIRDANSPKGVLAIFLLILIVLVIGSYFIFIF